ncbi:hypothetical protein [Geobacter sp. SVR]|uniref:hypothetical protein n=1 Tax=Geobacter sp. SVR TaxID=2495594 RepID=UPI00143EFBF9|nr:hypothetical protein [Geobacter sp. SVR]BCS52935.1 hypothetical protein GSVR_12430 [Geobacter sp. SVR]GCF84319.1 hypothetical protein GSbR_09190 [Geobacter sp. SVR]
MYKIFSVLILYLSILCGCSATGIKYGDSLLLKNEPADDEGTVIIYRSSIGGSPTIVKISFDGNELGKLFNNGYFLVNAKEGKHFISTY